MGRKPKFKIQAKKNGLIITDRPMWENPYGEVLCANYKNKGELRK